MKRLILFRLDELRMALPLSAVERILRAVYITPLPNAPEIVLGVINAQGQIIPVIDMRRRLGLPERTLALTDQLILARTTKRPVALVTDSVTGVLEYPDSKLTEVHAILPGVESVTGVIKLEDGLAYIHNLDSFLSLEEESSLDRAMATAGGP